MLFSERFHQVYIHLGMFSALYVLGGYQGVDRREFLEETRSYNTDTSGILSWLEDHSLIRCDDGKLHLNRWQFASMSVWDLLVLVEPWLQQEQAPALRESYEKLKRFSQATTLSSSYLEDPA